MDCSPPGSSVHGDSPGKNTGVGFHALLQGSSQPRDQTQVSIIAGEFFTVDSLPSEPQGKPKNIGVGRLTPSPGDLPDSGIELGSPALQVDSLPASLTHIIQASP